MSVVCAVFRIRENGEERCLQQNQAMEFLNAARLLRSCLHSGGGAAEYAQMLSHPEEISAEQFHQMAVRRLENTGEVTGAFELDFDRQEFSALNIMDGWKVFHMGDVSAAAHYAFREANGSEQRWSRFLERLDGREITDYVPAALPHSQRQLTAADISFSDEIMQNDNMLEFYMDVVFDPDAVFGTHVCTAENDNYLNVYANYDMDAGQVCGSLDVILVRNDGEAELRYPLSEEERGTLRVRMDEYCRQQMGQSLAECQRAYLAEEAVAAPAERPDADSPKLAM